MWDNFLWACELWYSNSMMVVLSSGKLSTCLVPIAGLLNHSVCSTASATLSLVFRFVLMFSYSFVFKGIPSYSEVWSSR
jgi:hypothetical protein